MSLETAGLALSVVFIMPAAYFSYKGYRTPANFLWRMTLAALVLGMPVFGQFPSIVLAGAVSIVSSMLLIRDVRREQREEARGR